MRLNRLLTILLALSGYCAFAQNIHNIVDFGAKGDNRTINTQSIQSAIDRCHAEGGGRVVVPNGVFVSATIRLKSNVTLHLEEGAVLKGVGDIKAYSKVYRSNHAFIYAEGQKNIAIKGRGEINGHGEHPTFQGGDPYNGIKDRPNTIFFADCTGVALEDFTLRNGARWNIKMDDCDNVLMDRVSVYSRVVANNDGVDFDDCHNVRVANCYFDTGDDGICAKSYSSRGVKNLIVTNCIVKSSSNGIKLGAVSVGSFEDIAISNCVIYDTRLSGIAIQSVDGAVVDRVTVTNITMKDVNGGIFMKLGRRTNVVKTLEHPGAIRNVVISNVIADGVGSWQPDKSASYYKEAYDSRIGLTIAGQPGYRIENVQLNNISIRFAGGGTAADAKIVMKDLPEVYPEYRNWGVTPAYAFNCRHVKGIQFNNVKFETLREDARPALLFEHAEGVVLNHVDAGIGSSATSVIRCRDVSDFLVLNNKPRRATAPFLAFEGRVQDITIMGNDFHRIPRIYTVEDGTDAAEIRLLNNIAK